MNGEVSTNLKIENQSSIPSTEVTSGTSGSIINENKDETKNISNPKTGNLGVKIWFILIIFSILGILVTAKKLTDNK